MAPKKGRSHRRTEETGGAGGEECQVRMYLSLRAPSRASEQRRQLSLVLFTALHQAVIVVKINRYTAAANLTRRRRISRHGLTALYRPRFVTARARKLFARGESSVVQVDTLRAARLYYMRIIIREIYTAASRVNRVKFAPAPYRALLCGADGCMNNCEP